MTLKLLPAEEQDLIDRWVESVLDNEPLSSEERNAFEIHLKSLDGNCNKLGSDLWNASWPGFHERETLGPHALISEAIEEAFEYGGIPGTGDYEAEDAIKGFRNHMENCWERNPGCGLIEIRDRENRSAWIGLDIGDWGELEGVWLCSSPKDIEASYRDNGYVFPSRESCPPSGVIDEFTDEQIINLLKIAAFQKLKELEDQQQRYKAEQEKKRLRREAAKARREANKIAGHLR